MTYNELLSKIRKHNEDNNITRQYADKNALKCVIVFKASNWDKDYSIEDRSYVFRSDEKHFLPDMLGNSCFASSLSGTDDNIRLDLYLPDWEIEDCYILD